MTAGEGNKKKEVDRGRRKGKKRYNH